MEKLSINNISKNFFRTTTVKKVDKNHTNPFGVSFKGNVLTADVFETKNNNVNLIERAKNKSRMLSSAVVGSITNLSSAISTRLNSVVSFGNRIRQNATDFWTKAQQTEIHIDMAKLSNKITSKMPSFTGTYKVSNLVKRPVSELEEMLKAELATI
ncbi:MAG TPA: hypothetical protein PLG15_01095 [Candidatus Gastranaerophilaceae bacterium]|nr:hypothetical protein [Candidatus Gastranaerophilaceae bacterium]